MHSIRRAALRAAGSSMKAAVALPRQRVAPFSMQIGKINSTRSLPSLSLARNFSQSARFLENKETPAQDAEQAIVDAATESAEGVGSSAPPPPQTYTVYVSNMVYDATDVHMKEAFSRFGEVVATRLGRDARGLSRGFGFVEFADEAARDQAVREADGTFWHGRRINVVVSAPRDPKSVPNRRVSEPKEPSRHLFIGNIAYETSDADLNTLFSGLEGVSDIRVAIDRNTGWPRGFAHADFVDVEAAKKAYEALQTTVLGGRNIRVDYSQPATKGPAANRNRNSERSEGQGSKGPLDGGES